MSKTLSKKKQHRDRSRGNGQGSVYRRKERGPWRSCYFTATGERKYFSTGTTDKSTADRIIAKRISEVALEKSGLRTPTDVKILLAEGKLITQHVDEYLHWCIHEKSDPENLQSVEEKRKILLSWISHTRLMHLSECTGEGLLDFLKWRQSSRPGRVGNKSTGARTWNIVRARVIVFISWCVKQGRIKENPLLNTPQKNESKDRRRERRAFTEIEEINLYKIGKDRGREDWYRLAIQAGLRKGDLKRLAWKNIFFNESGADIRITEQKAKDRDDIIPINKTISKILKKRFVKQGSDRNAKVFLHTVSDLTRDKDFVRAGILKVDSSGKYLDLHAGRKTLATRLVISTTPVATVQALMRHKDFRTTLAHYNDPNSHGAVEAKRKAMAMVNSKR